MGYELRIRRDWSDLNASEQISFEEWQAFVAQQDDFRLVGFAEATTPAGETLRIDSPGLTVWTGHPSAEKVWFHHDGDCIAVRNPDDAVLERMQQVAKALGARIRGDEGEFYDAPPV